MGPRYSYEFRDSSPLSDGRNVARLVLHDGYIYIETEGNHDGVVVCTSVRIERPHFVTGLKEIGGVL
jgi:hypothetical protein